MKVEKKYIVIASLIVITIFIIGFVAGTFAGFAMAVKQLSKCRQVSCELLGLTNNVTVSTTVCELCPQGGIRIQGNGDG